MSKFDVPESQHATMRAAQGRVFVEQAATALYHCAHKCRADGIAFPRDLDEAHAILWKHLERDEELRRRLVGEPADDAQDCAHCHRPLGTPYEEYGRDGARVARYHPICLQIVRSGKQRGEAEP